MASYAPNFTARVKLSYSALSANFTQTWRHGTGTAPIDIIDGLRPFYDAIAALLPSNFSFSGAETAAQGQDFFLPSSLSELETFEGTATNIISDLTEFRASALQFTGKTVTGNPWRVSVYSSLVAPFNVNSASLSDDFRISASDSTAIAGAIGALELLGVAGLVGNDGNPIIIRPYANIIISRYRINRIRRFG